MAAPNRKFLCTVAHCTKRFTSKPALSEHLRAHKGEKLSCDWEGCQYQCACQRTLRSHKATKHRSEGTEVLVCQWRGCDYNSSRSDNLKRHQSRCRFRPNIWVPVPDEDLPSGIRVTCDSLDTAARFQFGEEPENLPVRWGVAAQEDILKQLFPELLAEGAIAGPAAWPVQQAMQPAVDPAAFEPMDDMGAAMGTATFPENNWEEYWGEQDAQVGNNPTVTPGTLFGGSHVSPDLSGTDNSFFQTPPSPPAPNPPTVPNSPVDFFDWNRFAAEHS